MFDLVVMLRRDHHQEDHGDQDQQGFVAAADHETPGEGGKELDPLGHDQHIGHPLALSSIFLYKKSYSPPNYFS
jgi:hypothetical protein